METVTARIPATEWLRKVHKCSHVAVKRLEIMPVCFRSNFGSRGGSVTCSNGKIDHTLRIVVIPRTITDNVCVVKRGWN